MVDHTPPFVPADFTPPDPPRTDVFWLEPLGPEHNESDYEAWTPSIDHILATPGFEGSDWPRPMSLAENLEDLTMHARHFEERRGFTYTVRSTSSHDVIGCLYIYPSKDASHDAKVRSWVRAADSELDPVMVAVVEEWLARAWPFRAVDYR